MPFPVLDLAVDSGSYRCCFSTSRKLLNLITNGGNSVSKCKWTGQRLSLCALAVISPEVQEVVQATQKWLHITQVGSYTGILTLIPLSQIWQDAFCGLFPEQEL